MSISTCPSRGRDEVSVLDDGDRALIEATQAACLWWPTPGLRWARPSA